MVRLLCLTLDPKLYQVITKKPFAKFDCSQGELSNVFQCTFCTYRPTGLEPDSLVGQFESSLKAGIGDFSVQEVSMATSAFCNQGQVLADNKCGKIACSILHVMD